MGVWSFTVLIVCSFHGDPYKYNNTLPPLAAQRNLTSPPPTLYPQQQQPVSTPDSYAVPRFSLSSLQETSNNGSGRSKRMNINVWHLLRWIYVAFGSVYSFVIVPLVSFFVVVGGKVNMCVNQNPLWICSYSKPILWLCFYFFAVVGFHVLLFETESTDCKMIIMLVECSTI